MWVASELDRQKMPQALGSEIADHGLSAASGLLLASLVGVVMWAAIIEGVVTLLI